MAERISRKPDELAQQCDRASRSGDFREITGHAIGGEPNWPPTAPIAMTLLTCSQNIETQWFSDAMMTQMVGTATERVKHEERSTKSEVQRVQDRLALRGSNFALRSSDFILQTRPLVRPSHTRREYLIAWRVVIRRAEGVR